MSDIQKLEQDAIEAKRKFDLALADYEKNYPCGNPPPAGVTEALATLATQAGEAWDKYIAADV